MRSTPELPNEVPESSFIHSTHVSSTGYKETYGSTRQQPSLQIK